MEILIADDDASIRSALRKVLARSGHGVVEAVDGLDAIRTLGSRSVDVVITDLMMPGADGFAVLRYVRQHRPKVPVVVLTGEASIRGAVEAMRAGAVNFLAKPFNPADLGTILDQATRGRSGKTGSTPAPGAAEDDSPVALIGESQALRTVIETVERVAETSATVLLTGESGTGKEIVARLIHGASGRARGPLVVVNCGAIPDGLAESELFGHAKGSFTGATETRVGKFVLADGGTLFLDEIGELPLPLQVKLLRVLQEREVTPVGDSRSRSVDVRIVAATNRDLEAMVAAGTFRADLFYRLDILPIRLPALRERPEDVPLLANHFLESMNRRLGRDVALSDGVLALLKTYAWPGNVREMGNLFERLVILSRSGVIQIDDLPARMRGGTEAIARLAAATVEVGDGGIDLDAAVAGFERTLMERALQHAGGNKARAAELLGLSRTTLFDRLKRLG